MTVESGVGGRRNWNRFILSSDPGGPVISHPAAIADLLVPGGANNGFAVQPAAYPTNPAGVAPARSRFAQRVHPRHGRHSAMGRWRRSPTPGSAAHSPRRLDDNLNTGKQTRRQPAVGIRDAGTQSNRTPRSRRRWIDNINLAVEDLVEGKASTVTRTSWPGRRRRASSCTRKATLIGSISTSSTIWCPG